MEIQVDGSICRFQNHLKFSLSEKELSILRLNTLEGGRFCISQSMHNVKSCSALCLAHNFFMRPSRKAPSKDVQNVLLNFFFHNIKVIVLVKKRKLSYYYKLMKRIIRQSQRWNVFFSGTLTSVNFAVIERDYLAVIILGD